MASTDDDKPPAPRAKPDLFDLTNGKSSMAYALEGLTDRPPDGSEGSWTPDEAGSGRAEADDEGLLKGYNGDNARSGSTTAISSDGGSVDMSPASKRRRSIQVVIEESNKGRYIITADDPEFREIMRLGIEREAAKSKGKSNGRIRDLVFTRQFTTFDRQNPRAAQSPFHGFFTLFWLAMALLLLKIAAQNWRYQGSVFGSSEILHLMVDRDLFVMLTTDAIMCICTAFGFILQKLIAAGYLTWDGSGWIIQSVWQLWYTAGVIWICFYRDWPWTHTVFIVLHDLVLLMKQHSYTFYNGYLSRVYRRKKLLEEKLRQLESISAQPSPTSGTSPEAQALSASALENPPSSPTTLSHRRTNGPKYSTNLSSETSDIATMAQIIESRTPLDAEQIQAFTRILATEITILSDELRGKSTSASTAYPHNLTLTNFLDWTCLPTLVYDLEYPRLTHINWWYVAEKLGATLGVIWIMIIISQAYIYPIVVLTVRAKDSGMTLDERWKEFPWVVSDMLFPMLLEQLLSWYVIWECVLNVLAELTRFADRGFYGDWWNSVSWDQYARDWNRPVHNFLLRHVYHSSISAFRLSKGAATFMTFLLSACVHELLMFCLFKKVRGYLFALQLSQVPLAALSRTRLMRGRDTLGNIIFWVGLFIGPSLITSLYLIV